MLGERGEYEGPSRLPATGTVHLFQTFLLETRLLLCVPRPVGLHQQVKRIPSRVFLSFSFQKDYANKKRSTLWGFFSLALRNLGLVVG